MAKKESMKESVSKDHLANAKAKSLPVSTKHCIVISDNIRYKSTSEAKKILEGVSPLKKAIPFRRFNRDMGHKPGMASGRYPEKAAKEFIKLIKSVEANAQIKGLDVENLKIVKVISNKASTPMTGGRHRRGTKRTHIEIEVKEFTVKKDVKKKDVKSGKRNVKSVKPVKDNNELKENKKVDNEVEGKKTENNPEVKEDIKNSVIEEKEKIKKDTEVKEGA